MFVGEVFQIQKKLYENGQRVRSDLKHFVVHLSEFPLPQCFWSPPLLDVPVVREHFPFGDEMEDHIKQ